MLKGIAATVLAAAVLVGCGQSYQGDGLVTDKSFDDADDWMAYFPGSRTCSGTGQYRTCVQSPGYWMPRHDGPHWYLKVRDADGKKHTVEVSETEFTGCLTEDRWDGTNRRCA